MAHPLSDWRRTLLSRLTAASTVETSWPKVPGAARYRVLVRDETTGEYVLETRTRKPRCSLPIGGLDRGRRYEWRAQARARAADAWVDVLPPLRVPLPPLEDAKMTMLEWLDERAPAYRVVIRDETADEIVVKDAVGGSRYLVDWSELDPAHRHRFKLQAWSAGGWTDSTSYSDLYPPGSLAGPMAAIDKPASGAIVPRDPVKIRGWALSTPRDPVARIDVFVNGAFMGRARLAQPRPDVASAHSHPDAPIAGFTHAVAASDLRGDSDAIALGVRVHTIGGRTFGADEISARLQEPEPAFDDPDGHAAELRERVARVAEGYARPFADPPKLLVFAHKLNYGGAQLYLLDLLGQLVENGRFSCTVVSPSDGPLREPLERLGIRVHVTSGYGLTSVELYEGKLYELAAWMASEGFDLVLANTFQAPPAMDLAARLGLPGVLVVHASANFAVWSPAHAWSGAHRYVRERLGEGLKAAAAVIFGADATRRQYARYGDPDRFLTMPYGVRLDRIASYQQRFDRSEARRVLGIPVEARVVLCLGRVQPRKGQTSLAQAFAAVADEHPDALLCLVGDSGGHYSIALHEYVERAGLSRRVIIRPAVADPYQWYGVSDVLVSASDNESLPLAVLEAMAIETPVLATAVFGQAEVIEDGVTGYLCEPREVTDLAESLDRVLRAPPGETRAVARAGAALVREHHDSRTYADRFGRLLTALAHDADALPREVLAGDFGA